MDQNDIVQALSLLSPEALKTVATVLEHRANSAIAHMNLLPHKADISKAYAIFSNLADEALQVALDNREELELEARLIAGASK